MIQQRLTSLRNFLESIGLRQDEVSERVRSAADEIRAAMNSIVENAVYEAENYGSSIGADEFLAQIRLNADSGYIEISTDSGATDFSKPQYPMLPWLLNNAKTAKDGSRYKIIPVGGTSSNPKPTPQARNIAEGLSAMSSGEAPASAMAETMAAAFTQGSSSGMAQRQKPASTAKPEFRVASSKQDPSRQWVIPAKDLDMTGTLMTLNATIRSEIDKACSDIVNKYEVEAKKWRG